MTADPGDRVRFLPCASGGQRGRVLRRQGRSPGRRGVDVIGAQRVDDHICDVEAKVFTRDLFGES